MSVTPMLGISSTKVLKPGEAPTSLKVLVTDPKWKGKVVISRPIRGGTSSGALMNVVNAVGRDFIKTAKDRDILLTLGNEAAIASVVSGERPVSWGVSGYRAIEAKAEGSPIELIVWDEGLALAQFIGVVPAKAPHPNAARLLLRWLMTPEGQELLVKNVNQYSARKDVTDHAAQPAAAVGAQDQRVQQRADRQRRPRAGGRVRQGGGDVASRCHALLAPLSAPRQALPRTHRIGPTQARRTRSSRFPACRGERWRRSTEAIRAVPALARSAPRKPGGDSRGTSRVATPERDSRDDRASQPSIAHPFRARVARVARRPAPGAAAHA